MDYNKAYERLKVLPYIEFIVLCIASLIFGIVDSIESYTDLEFWWFPIGVVVASILLFEHMLALSATVVRTDAVVSIHGKLSKMSSDDQVKQPPVNK